jgi:hypothetical protein
VKRVLYALGLGVVTFVVGSLILLALGTNILGGPLTVRGVIVIAASIVVAVYTYLRILRSV